MVTANLVGGTVALGTSGLALSSLLVNGLEWPCGLIMCNLGVAAPMTSPVCEHPGTLVFVLLLIPVGIAMILSGWRLRISAGSSDSGAPRIRAAFVASLAAALPGCAYLFGVREMSPGTLPFVLEEALGFGTYPHSVSGDGTLMAQGWQPPWWVYEIPLCAPLPVVLVNGLLLLRANPVRRGGRSGSCP
ncbi:MAG: hypothetical protein L0216_17250 [Planctomycetales bacterium]|nr:hypothetical protein [Planctomycetales bacterium]